MIYNSAKIRLLSLVLILMARRCCCVSTNQGKERPLQNTQQALPTVTCSVRGIKAMFGPMVKNNLHVRDVSGTTIPLLNSKGSCGVRVGKDKNQNLAFFSRFDSCYARIEGNKVVIPLLVQLTGENRWIRVNISCPLIKRRSEMAQPTSSVGDCEADKFLRLDCGHQSITRSACQKLGCCYDAHTSACYYRLNACSLDGHFVFTVKATDTHPPIDPSNLVVKDQPHCLPVVSTPDTAVFKMGVMECGAKMKKDGELVIYEVEVEELNTKRERHASFNLHVACEYKELDLKRAKDLRSLYTVTNPPAAVAQGTIRVQMRLATDASFTTFFPEDQLPLKLPLRETVNVEISIVPPSPDPTLSLHVRDCFAYPVSKHSVWTLLHDGCPNPLDNMRSSVPVDNQGETTTHSQVRRFDVKTFAFLDPDTGKPSVEKMYFFCWVEICTEDIDCTQRCTIISSDAEGRRRRATPTSHHVQLISLGPLQLLQKTLNWVTLQRYSIKN
ncbi:zona pellucida sperm-binding protein 4-like [Girardinichthys multiradiatus]|uniref:zona pellucida sperm-binding protein 4-like n=1 Tax=Girardinichthys multiradiatus TaxID=208333 RepID=UPI001FAC6C19|nr:zona pellucida sperm-binding protein 4-like [Girardinichthys multiradiatus]